MRGSKRLVCVVAVALLPLGCGDSTGVDPAIGAWNLIEIDGMPLPFVWSVDGDVTLRALGARLDMQDGSCSVEATWQATFDVTPGPIDTIITACTWRRADSLIVFQFSDGPTTGSISGDRMSISNDQIGREFTYQRAG